MDKPYCKCCKHYDRDRKEENKCYCTECEAYVDAHHSCEMFTAPNVNIAKILASERLYQELLTV
ncbi:MAG: hypothetical protein J6B75_02105 [Ruminococcus sp.]|nr:hypothetical protein [Ruminococcus sp.]